MTALRHVGHNGRLFGNFVVEVLVYDDSGYMWEHYQIYGEEKRKFKFEWAEPGFMRSQQIVEAHLAPSDTMTLVTVHTTMTIKVKVLDMGVNNLNIALRLLCMGTLFQTPAAISKKALLVVMCEVHAWLRDCKTDNMDLHAHRLRRHTPVSRSKGSSHAFNKEPPRIPLRTEKLFKGVSDCLLVVLRIHLYV